MTNFGNVTFRFRVFDLGIHDEYEGIYDDLYLPKYREFVENANLICCELTCSRDTIKETFSAIHTLYEGMTYSVDAIVNNEVKHIIGGVCDCDDIDYINDWIYENIKLFITKEEALEYIESFIMNLNENSTASCAKKVALEMLKKIRE